MNLNSAVGDFFWDTFSWAKLLRLAERYGWQPAGTTIPDSELKWMPDGRWNGSYSSNDGQTVTTADAQALAAALERALAEIPDEDVLARYRDPSGLISLFPNPPTIDDRDWFCGVDPKSRVRDFIKYCHAGEFHIS